MRYVYFSQKNIDVAVSRQSYFIVQQEEQPTFFIYLYILLAFTISLYLIYIASKFDTIPHQNFFESHCFCFVFFSSRPHVTNTHYDRMSVPIN